jgi:general secretion pathway protein D
VAYRSISSCLMIALVLYGCAAPIQPELSGEDALVREGLAGTGADRSVVDTPVMSPVVASLRQPQTPPERKVIRGNRSFVAPGKVAATAQPKPVGADGISLNFTNQPIQTVVNVILGDILKEDFSIVQGVTGEVTFSTSKPVAPSEALSILQTLLSWTNNALIRQGSRFVVLPANQAVAGQLVPRLTIDQPPSGLTARMYVLDYLSAIEMQKLLQPFARENAFLLVDASRNVLVMAGTQEELNNYQSTIDTFDVNWLKGMSIGVFGLKRANVSELMPALDRMFGAQSGTPMAGMLRFLPIARTNAIVAISPQPEYLNEISQWIDTIDQGGGNEPQMYVYDVRNLKATDLAGYLRQIYSNAPTSEVPAARVAPGLRTMTLSSNTGTNGGLSSGASTISGEGGLGSMTSGNNPRRESGSDTVTQNTDGDIYEPTTTSENNNSNTAVRITAEKATNQLLVRCRPTEWEEIHSAIQRLDSLPMQVQIETRILEVSLTGALNLGVQWYLGHLAGNSTTPGIQNVSGSQGALGSGGAALGKTDALFYSFVSNNLQIAIRALETSGNTRVLSAPSLVVMNNQQAQIQVGDNIPINQTTINTGSSLVTTSSVQYIQTGVILDVVPRINPGGLVYMDVQQQVSDASAITDVNGNPTISTRAVSTQVAVQSGETVLLGGLIKDNRVDSNSSVPYLGKVPGLRWLFGSTSRSRGRTELIVLITPKVISGSSQAKKITDEYREQLQLMQPQSLKKTSGYSRNVEL